MKKRERERLFLDFNLGVGSFANEVVKESELRLKKKFGEICKTSSRR